MAPSILWFRRDLRLTDHPALHEAVRLGGADGVVPVFVLDDMLLAPSGPTRAAFLTSCLSELEASMGVPLTVLTGDPSLVIAELAAGLGAAHVVVTGDFAPVGGPCPTGGPPGPGRLLRHRPLDVDTSRSCSSSRDASASALR